MSDSEIFQTNVKRTRGGEPSPKTDNDAARRRVARLVGFLNSLLLERSHTEENPTKFIGSTEHKDGTHTIEFCAKVKVSQEEYDLFLENRLWDANLFLKEGSVVAQIDPNCL